MPATLPHQASDAPKQANERLKIGNVDVDPPVLQAPMAGYTNYAFRQVVREFGGAGLLATEMIAARSAIWLETNKSSFSR